MFILIVHIKESLAVESKNNNNSSEKSPVYYAEYFN